MRTWIFLTLLLVSAVTGYVDNWGLIHWSKTEEELLKCLNDTKLPDVLNENILYAVERSYVIGRIGYLFHKQTEAADSIEVIACDMINAVKEHLYYLHQQTITEESLDAIADVPFNEDQKERVKEAIIEALYKCADPEDPNSRLGGIMILPPRFVQEIPEIAELLNTILVYNSPRTFTLPRPDESEYARTTLYSERSLTLIEMALRRMNNAHELLKELLIMWRRRVGLFYIDKWGRPEYLRFFYNPNQPQVITYPSEVIRAGLVNLTVRDEPASNRDVVFQMARYHVVNWNNSINSSVFSVPSTANETISNSQSYFRLHMHHFFQSLFAYLESAERGLTDQSEYDEWQVYNEELKMLRIHSWDGYEAYLENVQTRELSYEFARNSPTFSSLIESFQGGDQIDEFDLTMMYWHRLRSLGVTTTNWNLTDKLYRITDLLRSYWSRLGCIDIVNMTAQNWNFKDKLSRVTNLLTMYWNRSRSIEDKLDHLQSLTAQQQQLLLPLIRVLLQVTMNQKEAKEK